VEDHANSTTIAAKARPLNKAEKEELARIEKEPEDEE
jgi:hypothetical protein